MTKNRPASAWNIANYMTAFRLLIVPTFGLTLWLSDGHKPGWLFVSFFLFSIALFTDYADGVLARTRGLITPFGQIADPIADKALIITALVGLSLLDRLPWWVTVVIVVREIGITLLRFWVIRRGIIPASIGGKVKTALQGLAVGWYLLPWSTVGLAPLRGVAPIVMGAAVIVTVLTGLDYVRRALPAFSRFSRQRGS